MIKVLFYFGIIQIGLVSVPTALLSPDFHIQMIDRGWLHGIEIANGEGYSEEAFSLRWQTA